MPQHRPVEEILDTTHKQAEQGDRVSLGDLMDAIGHRGYGPFLFLPALLVLTPVGGVPGVPSGLAVVLLVFSVQIIAGRQSLWLPQWLKQRSVDAQKVETAAKWLKPAGSWLDRWFTGWLPALATPQVYKLAAGLCILLAVVVPALEIIPFGAAIPMFAIAGFGLGMTLKDGLLMLLGFVFSALTLGSIVWVL